MFPHAQSSRVLAIFYMWGKGNGRYGEEKERKGEKEFEHGRAVNCGRAVDEIRASSMMDREKGSIDTDLVSVGRVQLLLFPLRLSHASFRCSVELETNFSYDVRVDTRSTCRCLAECALASIWSDSAWWRERTTRFPFDVLEIFSTGTDIFWGNTWRSSARCLKCFHATNKYGYERIRWVLLTLDLLKRDFSRWLTMYWSNLLVRALEQERVDDPSVIVREMFVH